MKVLWIIVASVSCMFSLRPLPVVAQVAATESETNLGNNTSQYTYAIANTGQVAIAALSFDVQTSISNVNSPTGWSQSTSLIGGDTIILWQASDTPYEIQPDSFLSGFSLDSTSSSGSIQYSAFDEDFDGYQEMTQGPVPSAPVPEATTFVSFGLGVLLLSGMLFVARKRAGKLSG